MNPSDPAHTSNKLSRSSTALQNENEHGKTHAVGAAGSCSNTVVNVTSAPTSTVSGPGPRTEAHRHQSRRRRTILLDGDDGGVGYEMDLWDPDSISLVIHLATCDLV